MKTNNITYRRVEIITSLTSSSGPKKQTSLSANWVSECRWHSNRRTDQSGRREKMHKDYLEHNKRGLFMLMITKCTLWPYLADVDHQANEIFVSRKMQILITTFRINSVSYLLPISLVYIITKHNFALSPIGL
ncbi:MAG: TnpV protein [Clostridia bacterium]|nr:TnpV protein [Clostridia bacterium]